jgi:hypothetical protein
VLGERLDEGDGVRGGNLVLVLVIKSRGYALVIDGAQRRDLSSYRCARSSSDLSRSAAGTLDRSSPESTT